MHQHHRQGGSMGYVKSVYATKLGFKDQLSMQASKQVNQQRRRKQEHTRGKGKKQGCKRLRHARGKGQLQITNYKSNKVLVVCSPRRCFINCNLRTKPKVTCVPSRTTSQGTSQDSSKSRAKALSKLQS